MKKPIILFLTFFTAAFMTGFISYYYYKLSTNKDRLNFTVSECLENPDTEYFSPQSFAVNEKTQLQVKVVQFLPNKSTMLTGGSAIKDDVLQLRYYVQTAVVNNEENTCPRMLTYTIDHIQENLYKIEVIPGDDLNIFFIIGYQISEIRETIKNFPIGYLTNT